MYLRSKVFEWRKWGVSWKVPGLLAVVAAILAVSVMHAAPPAPTGSGKQPSACGDYGTAIEFEPSPKDAAKRAAQEEKLVMVLHVSGHFEDPALTSNNAEALRVSALADPRVGEFVNRHFVSSFQKVGTFRIVGRQKQGGNVATYFCAFDGRVLHVIPGPVDANTFLAEARWVVESVRQGLAENKKTGKLFKVLFREYHAERLRHQYGLVVEPVRFDPDVEAPGALSYRDPTGAAAGAGLTASACGRA